MAHHSIINGSVSAESLRIRSRTGIDFRTPSEEHLEDLFLIEIDREVQERGSINRSPVHSRTSIVRAAKFRRINLHQTEAAFDQGRIATQKFLELCDIAAVERHDRRVRQYVTLARKNLEHRMFPGGMPPIRFEDERQRRERISFRVGERCAQLRQETKSCRIQRLTGAHHDSRGELGPVFKEPARAFQLSLK